MDPLLFYREATIVATEGLPALYRLTHTAHPPLLQGLVALAFGLVGRSPAAYTAVGVACFAVGALMVNAVVSRCYSSRAAFAATLLLYSCPLVLVNAFYPTHETVLLAVVASALYFFAADRFVPFRWSLIPLVFLKQTALVALASFFAARLLDRLRRGAGRRRLADDVADFLPAVAAGLAWAVFLRALGGSEWRGDLLGQAAGGSTYAYLGERLLHLGVFNAFLRRNLENALIYNWQWSITLSALALTLGTAARRREPPSPGAFRCATFLAIFSPSYALLVLSIPTWTIPRYGIPLLLGPYVALGVAAARIGNRGRFAALVTVLWAVSWVANLSSLDPVTARHGALEIYGQRLYDVPEENAGADRLTYNLQFLDAVASQNALVAAALRSGADGLVTDCAALKLDEKLAAIALHPEYYPYPAARPLFCAGPEGLGDPGVAQRLTGRVLYVGRDDRSRLQALVDGLGASISIVGDSPS
ncbi:MAG: glycosyltransferase family 39 protein [Deltaproteobacteria bacterium]|nr:glycosyltransferase family 39 protein [Deltaproteobacteria bacterium]